MRPHPQIKQTLVALALVAGILGLFCGDLQAQSASSNGAQGRQAKLDAAIKQMTHELEGLENFENPPAFHWKRPHPAMKGWGPKMAPIALQRMQRDFTGQTYLDSFIRWHLIYTVQQALEADFNTWRKTGEHEVSPQIVDGLKRLAQAMPKPMKHSGRPEYKREPYAIWKKYLAVRRKTRIRIGYPPFDQTYSGRDALKLVKGARKKRFRKLIERMEKLRKQFKTIRDPQAAAYNDRIGHLNRIARAYRGDIVYTMIQTGDKRLLKMIIDAMGKQVAQNQIIAFDMLKYAYIAGFDGYLALYGDSTRETLGRQLEAVARKAEGYEKYRIGKKELRTRRGPRNFADAAFSLVQLLRDPYMVHNMAAGSAPKPTKPPALTDKTYTAENLTVEDIRHAIQRAIYTLYTSDKEGLRPDYKAREEKGLAIGRRGWRGSTSYQRIVHRYGNQALIGWALLQSGESYLHPEVYKRINWTLAEDVPYTFDRGMRLEMLSKLPTDRFGPWVRRDVLWLGNALTDQGNFPYKYRGQADSAKNGGWGDHANGQYGVLGVWAALRAGGKINDRILKLIDHHWRASQADTAGDSPAGWALGMLGKAKKKAGAGNANELNEKVTGPMTAAGVATLTLTERYLQSEKRGKIANPSRSSELTKGLEWLNQYFTLGKTTKDDSASDENKKKKKTKPNESSLLDWYYYMWTMQRVGKATGVSEFNHVDWFRQITAEMLNRQAEDGLWHDPKGNQSQLVSTGFALLYLGAALEPITLSKLRFDGSWNNRPHDLWNFVDYASDMYEAQQSWQIVDLSQPVYKLIESPILFLASDKQVDFNDQQVAKLRDYIEAGGLLVCNPDGAESQAVGGFNRLAEELFPNRELSRPPRDYALLNVHHQVRSPMRVIDNGIRPLMVVLHQDLSKQLQSNDTSKPAFKILSNMYLYSVGRNPRRERLESTHLVQENNDPKFQVNAAIIEHQGASNPEPNALPQLAVLLANRHDIDLRIKPVKPRALSTQGFAYLAATPDAKINDQQANAIRKWLDNGAKLWIDAVGGSQAAVDAANTIRKQIAPKSPPRQVTNIRPPLLTGKGLGHNAYDNTQVVYRAYTLQRSRPTSQPSLTAVVLNNRPALITSQRDVTAGLAGLDQWGILGYAPTSARKLLANAIISTLPQQPDHPSRDAKPDAASR